MRGTDKRSGDLFSYVGVEQRVRADHPLRSIGAVVNEALEVLSGEFAAPYSGMGRPSIPPEMLLRAMLLQAFYSVRSERQSPGDTPPSNFHHLRETTRAAPENGRT